MCKSDKNKNSKCGNYAKEATSIARWMAQQTEGNAKKIATNERKRVERERGAIADAEQEQMKEKKMKTAGDLFDARINPAEILEKEVGLTMAGMLAAVVRRTELEGIVAVPVTGGIDECDAALDTLAAESSDAARAVLVGLQKTHIEWKHRAAGAFLLFHPSIYGVGDLRLRVAKVAGALGVGKTTAERWFILKNKDAKANVEKWLPLVENMTWKDAAKSFSSEWAKKWKVGDDEKIAVDRLAPYKEHIRGSKKSFLSKYTPGTTTAGRKSAEKNDNNVTVLKDSTKHSKRGDAGKGRKFLAQEEFLVALVNERWHLGDPIGRIELRDELMARDDCQEGRRDQDGHSFYESYLAPSKASGLANWLKRVLKREGWSFRKNSVGQTVPDDWLEKAMDNAKRICERFRAAGVEEILNADQTFVKYYSEEDTVVAPTNIKRVGGLVKADVKKGFTAMVAVNLKTSEMEPPFVVFNGTKMKDAKYPLRTLAHKHRNWRHSGNGRTGYIAFQKKHWFDEDITIEWLDYLLNVRYPGKKVAISMDMAPCQTGARVKKYIEKMTNEGRLVVAFIDGGLTSVLQVCDLAANKEFKDTIKKLYLKYRANFLRAERAKTPNKPNKRIDMKMPIVEMMDIVEKSVKLFNVGQLETRSIEKTFISAGQHPWKDCSAEFKTHLDNLSKLPLYGGAKTVEQVLADRAMAASKAETLGPGRGEGGCVRIVLEEEEELDLETETAGEVV